MRVNNQASAVAQGYYCAVLSKLKPPWLSGYALVALAAQAFLGGLLAYAVFANHVGILKSPPGAPPYAPSFNLGVFIWGLLAIAAAVAIYRNKWWAYFLEIVLLWTLVVAVVLQTAPEPAQAHSLAFDTPLFRNLRALADWYIFLWLNWHLLKRGVQEYRAAKGALSREAGRF